MGFLKVAAVEQSAAKVGIFAPQGAGKTTTSALIAIGLSKTYHNGAAVSMQDTENGSDYLVEIFKMEGVPFLAGKSRAFTDMKAALREAEEAKACAHIVDSYTHPWLELIETFKAKSKRKKLEFHHMDQLKTLWRGWTDMFLNSPLHVIVAGRRGFEWGEGEDSDGDGKLIKLGTKMKGETEAGYEPSLLIEMEGIQDADTRLKKSRAKRGTITHHAYVLKDRWRTLNGRTFTFKDINNYKVGDWKPVFEAFRPHFDRLAIGQGQRAVDGNRTSGELFHGPDGESDFQKRLTRIQIALEEIKEVAAAVWPGQTEAAKKSRQTVLECLFDTLSWTAVEQRPLSELEEAAEVLKWVRNVAARDTSLTLNDPSVIQRLIDDGRTLVREDTTAREEAVAAATF
jgi:hypothetical protein